MAWFKRESGELDNSGKKTVRTEGLWVKCESCRQIIWKKDLEENLNVCPKCEKHFRIDARTRLALLLDENQYETLDGNLSSTVVTLPQQPEAVSYTHLSKPAEKACVRWPERCSPDPRSQIRQPTHILRPPRQR